MKIAENYNENEKNDFFEDIQINSSFNEYNILYISFT